MRFEIIFSPTFFYLINEKGSESIDITALLFTHILRRHSSIKGFEPKLVALMSSLGIFFSFLDTVYSIKQLENTMINETYWRVFISNMN